MSNARTARDARTNALAALARRDEPEFTRLSLDYTGAMNRLAEVDQIRAALRATHTEEVTRKARLTALRAA